MQSAPSEPLDAIRAAWLRRAAGADSKTDESRPRLVGSSEDLVELDPQRSATDERPVEHGPTGQAAAKAMIDLTGGKGTFVVGNTPGLPDIDARVKGSSIP